MFRPQLYMHAHKKNLTLFLLLIGLIVMPLRVLSENLEEYQQLEEQSFYYIFTTKIDKKQHFPELEKLVFTTPWNPEGQERTLQFAHKLDYVVPCWYQVTFKKQHILIDSDANYNQSYIKMLRQKNPVIKILPRVSIVGSKKTLIKSIGATEGRFKRAVSLVATLINRQDVDGVVLETAHNLFLRDSLFEDEQQKQENIQIKKLILQLVNSIRINLFKKKLIYFMVPNPGPHLIDLANQRFVMLHVDAFLVQGFNSISYQEDLNHAISWVKLATTIKTKAKYFIVLPFFSQRQRQGIKASEVYRVLRKQGFIYQSIQNGICSFIESHTHVQSYVPCYYYFKNAFHKIIDAGLQVGFFQAGDGLDNYFRLM